MFGNYLRGPAAVREAVQKHIEELLKLGDLLGASLLSTKRTE
jgi:hypothetical protein